MNPSIQFRPFQRRWRGKRCGITHQTVMSLCHDSLVLRIALNRGWFKLCAKLTPFVLARSILLFSLKHLSFLLTDATLFNFPYLQSTLGFFTILWVSLLCPFSFLVQPVLAVMYLVQYTPTVGYWLMDKVSLPFVHSYSYHLASETCLATMSWSYTCSCNRMIYDSLDI